MASSTAIATQVDASGLAPPSQELLAQVRGTLDIRSRDSISQYGIGAQREAADFADRILAVTKNKDMGDTGTLLTDVLEKAGGLDPASLGKQGFFTRIFGGVKSQIARFKSRYESVASQIEMIGVALEKRQDDLRRDVVMLDGLHANTMQSIQHLHAYVIAGEDAQKEFESVELPKLKGAVDVAKANGSDGMLEAQMYQDGVQAVERLDKKILYLRQARQVAIQALPQIRVVQASDETLIENLQATATLAIPIWKRNMALALGLQRQKEALELNKAVTDATNEMMRKSAEMLKDQSLEVERQSQEGIVKIETLQKVNDDLIATVRGVIALQQQGRVKRAEAEAKMDQMTLALRDTLVADSAPAVR
jgi:uncharacterized protein YaaN involved in tellurite resistance